MKSNAVHRHPHYAWAIMAACLVLSGVGSGIFISTLGAFVRPVCEELGFSRGLFNLYNTIFYISNLSLMPCYGSLFQRYSFRKTAFLDSVMLAVAVLGYSFSRTLWQFYFFALLSGIFFNGIGIMAVGILINRWFTDRRGFASGIAFSGSGIFAAVLLPVCNSLIERFGWVWAYRFVSAAILAMSLPILLFVIRDQPEDMGLEPYKDRNSQLADTHQDNSGVMRSEAFRSVSFWLLFLSVIGIAFCQAGPNTNTVSILMDIGYSSAFSTDISSAYMIMLTASKIVIGYVFDRLGTLKGGLLISACCTIYPIAALFNTIPAVPWVYIFFLSIASSGSTVLGPALAVTYFGRKDYARIYSVIALGTQLGAAISNPILGSAYDITGGYSIFWFMSITIGAVVCITLIAADRKRLDF